MSEAIINWLAELTFIVRFNDVQNWFEFPAIECRLLKGNNGSFVTFSFVSSVHLDFGLADTHFKRRCCSIGANYVIMACYNAITGLDPGDCLFKKQ